MKNPLENYWHVRLADLKTQLESNNFEAFVADDVAAAAEIVRDRILPALRPQSVSWGGSMTFVATGLYEELRDDAQVETIDTYDHSVSAQENLERRRRALLTDLFFTGTNAVTETGALVNLDMIGNRVAALTFGPRNVVVLVGRNKIVSDLPGAFARVKGTAAPVNTMRLDKNTPCAKSGRCHDCRSPERICNTWTITEKSFPKGRVKVILINRDLGF